MEKQDKKPYYFPPKLMNRLHDIVEYPLTIVEAPSGFGKTTAVTQYLNTIGESCDSRHFWYTCFGEPIEKTWRGISLLLNKANENNSCDFTKQELPIGSSLGSTLADILASMKDFDCSTQTIIVVDNFQFAKVLNPISILDALSLHDCKNLHIVIITQTLLQKALRTAQNTHIAKIDGSLFTFDKKDIEELFCLFDIKLTPKELDQVYITTEGWISAIRLQMINFIEKGKFENSKGISSLMEQAFWYKLTDEQREFLMAVSVFEDFSVGQAAIMATRSGKGLLPPSTKQLLDSTAFIYHRSDTNVYCLHGILKTFLREKFKYMDDEFKFNVWSKAGESCEKSKNFHDAATFYLMANQTKKILSLPIVGKELEKMVRYKEGEIPKILLDTVAEEEFFNYPDFVLKATLELFLQGNLVLFERYDKLLQKLLLKAESYDEESLNKIKGEAEYLRIFLCFNDIDKMREAQESSYNLLKAPTKTFSYKQSWTFGAPSIVYMLWRESGKLDEEFAKLSGLVPNYKKLVTRHANGTIATMKAEMLFLSGNDGDAEALCYKALYQAKTAKQDNICFCAQFLLARIAIFRGDCGEYDAAVENIKAIAFGGDDDALIVADICLALLNSLLRRYSTIPQWLSNPVEILSKLYTQAAPTAHIVYARLLLHQAGTKKFEGIVGELLAESESLNMLFPKVYYYILLAVEKETTSSTAAALEYLEKALDLCLPDRIYMPFAEVMFVIAPLIKAIAKTKKYKAEDINMIISLGEKMTAGMNAINKTTTPASGVLSAREREVALLAKSGLSAKQIATKLSITYVTVRNTTQNIYTKLDVHSKVELLNKEIN